MRFFFFSFHFLHTPNPCFSKCYVKTETEDFFLLLPHSGFDVSRLNALAVKGSFFFNCSNSFSRARAPSKKSHQALRAICFVSTLEAVLNQRALVFEGNKKKKQPKKTKFGSRVAESVADCGVFFTTGLLGLFFWRKTVEHLHWHNWFCF